MDDEEAMKGFWPGALLKLSDGSGGVTRYAYVPLKGSVKKGAPRSSPQVKVSHTGAETGGEYWDSAKMKSDIVGWWRLASPASPVPLYKIGGLIEAKLSPAVNVGGLINLNVDIDGEVQVKPIDEIMESVGFPVDKWATVEGADAVAPVFSVNSGLITDVDPMKVGMSRMGSLTDAPAKHIEAQMVLMTLGLMSGGSPPQSGELAKFVARLVGMEPGQELGIAWALAEAAAPPLGASDRPARKEAREAGVIVIDTMLALIKPIALGSGEELAQALEGVKAADLLTPAAMAAAIKKVWLEAATNIDSWANKPPPPPPPPVGFRGQCVPPPPPMGGGGGTQLPQRPAGPSPGEQRVLDQERAAAEARATRTARLQAGGLAPNGMLFTPAGAEGGATARDLSTAFGTPMPGPMEAVVPHYARGGGQVTTLESLAPIGAAATVADVMAQLGGAEALQRMLAELNGRQVFAGIFPPAGDAAMSVAATDFAALLQRAGGAPDRPRTWPEAASALAHIVARAQTNKRPQVGGGGGGGPPRDSLADGAMRSAADGRMKVEMARGGNRHEMWRAVGNTVVSVLGQDSVVAAARTQTAEAKPEDEVWRLSHAPGHELHDAGWGILHSNLKTTGPVGYEGKLCAPYVMAAHAQHAWVRRMLVRVVGEAREREVAGRLDELAWALITMDLSTKEAWELLGGIAPLPYGEGGSDMRGRAQRDSGSVRTCWGKTTGLTAASDLERAMGELGQLLGQVQGYAGRGIMGTADGFGLKGLAMRAARVLGEADLLTLMDDLFEDLARKAKAKRQGEHPGPIDIGSAVMRTEMVDLPFLRQRADRDESARSAARDEMSKHRGKRAGSPPPGPGATKAARQQAEAAAKQQGGPGSSGLGRPGGILKLGAGTIVPYRAGIVPPPPPGSGPYMSVMKSALASVADGKLAKLIITGQGIDPLSHAVGCFDVAQQAAMGTARGAQACPFAFLLPPCKKADSGRCEKCAAGVKPPGGLVELIIAKCDTERASLVRDKRKAANLD